MEKLKDKLMRSSLKIGIIAGGQLGKMLIQEASKWDIATYVLDADPECPAGALATKYIKGKHTDFKDVYEFGKEVDLLTFEIESVNIDALKQLQQEGVQISPKPFILEIIQDKGLQKQFLFKNDINTASFKLYNGRDEILDALKKGAIKLPFVQKLRKGGYDGKGVIVIEDERKLNDVVDVPSVVEKKVDIDKEVSLIIGRNNSGDIRCYPVVEMVFDPTANLLDKLISPGNIEQAQVRKMEELAMKIVNSLEVEGVLAIEFFIDKNGEVLVNEMAPRPHNSGHHTLESVMTSQFEQHLRGILDLPLGSTKIIKPSVMINILGEDGYEGPVRYEGLEELFRMEGVNIHLYGKKITRPYRKMGHITVLGDSIEEASLKAEEIKKKIKVRS
ncbi:MAG: 5-(carboxyamino)imidazole ribonucleotide synthase [Calditerrivibrio sp.]|nr:5-(carboxyamino)imidazole ribonucleotide synthase [Calditerrivibrio sp.]